MEPVAVRVRDDGEWALVHRCRGCATERLNRIAGDDNSHVLMRLAARSPFPMHNLADVR
jgi:RNHCP domain